MKAIYTLIGLLVFAAAFPTDTFAQKGSRNEVGKQRSTGKTVHTGSANGGVWKTSKAKWEVSELDANKNEVRSRQIVDGTSNTIMFKRVATGEVNGNLLMAGTYGRGDASDYIDAGWIEKFQPRNLSVSPPSQVIRLTSV
jgi:hypothetical protein